MVESFLTEALGAETGIMDMDHLVGASMKHTYHVHLWYACRFVHNHKFKTPWKTGIKAHLTDGMKDFLIQILKGEKVLKVPWLQQKEIFLRNLKRDLRKKVKTSVIKYYEKIILINLILLSTGLLHAHEKDMMHKVPMNSEVNLEKNDSSSPVVVESVKNSEDLDSWIENYVGTNYPGYRDILVDQNNPIVHLKKLYDQNRFRQFYEEANELLIKMSQQKDKITTPDSIKNELWMFYLISSAPFLDLESDDNVEWMSNHLDLDYEVKQKIVWRISPKDFLENSGIKDKNGIDISLNRKLFYLIFQIY